MTKLAEAQAEIAELKRHIRHLEQRLGGQKREVTTAQGKNRLWNVKVEARHQGREALLLQMHRESQQALFGWKREAEKAQAEIRALRTG